MTGKFKVHYHSASFVNKIIVNKYYHNNVHKNFAKYFTFEKQIRAMNKAQFPKIKYVYKNGIIEIRQTKIFKEKILICHIFTIMI